MIYDIINGSLSPVIGNMFILIFTFIMVGFCSIVKILVNEWESENEEVCIYLATNYSQSDVDWAWASEPLFQMKDRRMVVIEWLYNELEARKNRWTRPAENSQIDWNRFGSWETSTT